MWAIPKIHEKVLENVTWACGPRSGFMQRPVRKIRDNLPHQLSTSWGLTLHPARILRSKWWKSTVLLLWKTRKPRVNSISPLAIVTGNSSITSHAGKEYELVEGRQTILCWCCWHLFEIESWHKHCRAGRWVENVLYWRWASKVCLSLVRAIWGSQLASCADE